MRKTIPGDIVLVTNGSHYPLPRGLNHGDTVKLLAFDHGYWEVEKDGVRYLVFLMRLDPGLEFEIAPGC